MVVANGVDDEGHARVFQGGKGGRVTGEQDELRRSQPR